LNENNLSAAVGISLHQIGSGEIWLSQAGKNSRFLVSKKRKVDRLLLAKSCHLPFLAPHTNTHHLDFVAERAIFRQHGVQSLVFLYLLEALMTVFIVKLNEDVLALDVFQRNGPFIVLDLQVILVSAIAQQYQVAEGKKIAHGQLGKCFLDIFS
jgi:hypothetical protein